MSSSSGVMLWIQYEADEEEKKREEKEKIRQTGKDEYLCSPFRCVCGGGGRQSSLAYKV